MQTVIFLKHTMFKHKLFLKQESNNPQRICCRAFVVHFWHDYWSTTETSADKRKLEFESSLHLKELIRLLAESRGAGIGCLEARASVTLCSLEPVRHTSAYIARATFAFSAAVAEPIVVKVLKVTFRGQKRIYQL